MYLSILFSVHRRSGGIEVYIAVAKHKRTKTETPKRKKEKKQQQHEGISFQTT